MISKNGDSLIKELEEANERLQNIIRDNDHYTMNLKQENAKLKDFCVALVAGLHKLHRSVCVYENTEGLDNYQTVVKKWEEWGG